MFERIKQPNLLHEILSQIQQNVCEGKLRKGDKLPTERVWASTLGVSRTTLREAVKSLELIGLVECRQGDGNYISGNLTNSFVLPLSIMFQLECGTPLQIHQFREGVEVAAVRAAALTATTEQVTVLADICDTIERGGSALQSTLASLDRKFHMTIAEISGNPLIVTMSNAGEALIENHIRGARDLMMTQVDSFEMVNRQHRLLVDALARHDMDAAVQAISEHMTFIKSFYDRFHGVG